MYNSEQVIAFLEEANGIKLSDEQKAVLESPNDKALLINAAAGSGKTTIIIMMMIKRILTGEIQPDEILAITFSKQAQLDMSDRYDQYVNKLRMLNVLMPVEKPHFSTFHAFFYQILRRLPEYAQKSVISSPMEYNFALQKYITNTSDQVLSKSEILENIFNTYQFLLNTNHSLDGIHLIHSDYDDEDEEVMDISKLYLTNNEIINKIVHEDLGINFWSDYVDVIDAYAQLKADHNQMDFNDMSTLLAKALDNPFNATQLTTASAIYETLIIDEFQDINHSQWELIQRLMLPHVIDNMIAIGDNDQAIYGFRGSTPKFIMEFNQILTNSITLNLSTNYRTGGIILDEARKIIEDNQYRLDKDLLAFRKTDGQVIIHKNTMGQFSQHSSFLLDLKANIQQNDPDKSIALLTRYNSDAMLVIDWLARNGIYVTTPKHLILNQNKLYKNFMTLAYAFHTDNLAIFRDVSRIVGFKSLETAIDEIVASTHITKLSDLPAMMGNNFQYDERMEKHRQNIQEVCNFVAIMPDNEPAQMGQFFQMLMGITSSYYNYMIKQKYIVEEIYSKLINYMYQLFQASDDEHNSMQTFFDKELEKNQLVESPTINYSNIIISSMHQSKGLEYDDVYLFGLRANDGEDATIKLERILGYDVDTTRIHNIQKANYKRQVYIMNQLKRLGVPSIRKLIRTVPFDDIITDDYNAGIIASKLQQKFEAIEEERRLIYVGMTRAKSKLHLDSFIEMSPLLTRVIHD